MPGLWKEWKAQQRLPTLSTSSLEISPNPRRDSHIPTAPATRAVEKWKTPKRFSTFPPPRFPVSQDNNTKPKPWRRGCAPPQNLTKGDILQQIRSPGIHSSFGLIPHWNQTFDSGSSRAGINSRFQAHFWIGKCCVSKLLQSRIHASGPAPIPGLPRQLPP